MAIKTYKSSSTEQLSNNFRAYEFACTGKTCCASFKVDEQLVSFLQAIRDHFGKPVNISSAYRCAKRNKAVGGSSGSQHLKGKAADIYIKGVAPAEVAKFAESIGILGIGLYEGSDGNFVHIDTRTKKSFWYGHKQLCRVTFGGAGKLPTLVKGSRGEAVKALQNLLNACGCDCGKADGILGAKTVVAIEEFERAGGWKSLTGVE